MTPLTLGLFLNPTGQHIAGWRHPAVPADFPIDIRAYMAISQLAESASLDFVFLADNEGVKSERWPEDALSRTANRFVGQLEPLTALSAIAAATTRIGLIGTASATTGEPYRVARQFASLDLISGGRAGWNAVTSIDADVARNFAHLPVPDADERYPRSEEMIAVVKGLWRSWDANAFIRDKQSGRYFDPARLHRLDHKGRYFEVRGPLNVPPSPQGEPVVFLAGSSGDGKELAARHADCLFTSLASPDRGRDFYVDVKGRLSRYGRAQDSLRIIPGMVPIVGATRAEALAKQDQLETLIDPVVGLAHLSFSLGGVDLSGLPLDEPLPKSFRDSHEFGSRALQILDAGQDLTVRELYVSTSRAKGHFSPIGSGEEVADAIETWAEAEAADGFVVMPTHTPGGLEDFIAHVVPKLRARGLIAAPSDETTLRGRLNLERQSGRQDNER
jgi:FMN-dependent oxidoreductase (nitrilotriacetate monooxygenase family)